MGNHRKYSKGCGTCLKRRVKCDERHPFCKRCEKGGFPCDGYKQAEFVDAREQIDKRTAPQAKPKSIQCKSAASDTRSVQGHDDNLDSKILPYGTDRGEELETISLAGRIPKSIPSPSLADEVYVCFTLENLCKGPAAVMYSYSGNLCGRCATESTMNQCLLALATVFYGLRHRQTPILYDGMRRYGRGLAMLKEAVAGNNFDVTTETIVSVWILSVIDCIKPNTKFAWMTHILGLERLFSLRGSISNTDSTILDRALLETCRPLLILTAFFIKTPSIMSNTEWKVTSQIKASSSESFVTNKNPITISHLDVVMEFLAELPALFLQVDECIQTSRANDSSPSSTRIFMVYTSISQFQQRLQPIGENLYEEDSVMNAISPTTTNNTPGTMPWTTGFRFRNSEHAITLSMYNATLILLNSIPIALLKASLVDPFISIAETSNDHQSIQSQSLLSETRSLMHEIRQSVKFYLHYLDPAEAPADYYLFFPMYVALRASIQHDFEEERIWLHDAFKAMEDKFRMGVCAQMDFDGRFSGLGEGLFG